MKTQTNKIVTLLASAAVMICGSARAQLYSEPFTTDTSAAWTIRAASLTAVDDYTAQFAFDYSTNKFVRGGVTNTIPLAPNSTIGVATNGLKLTVNKNDAIADASGINLYPNLSSTFSNDFALKFDMWVNYNGGEFGGTGSTEFGIWGINMSGLNTNWAAGGPEIGDGVWYGVTGEGGAARDWRSYVGDAVFPAAPLELQGVSGGFFDRDFDAIVEQEVFGEPDSAPLRLMFPRPTYETAGVPGKQWIQVEVRQRTNNVAGNWVHEVTWLMNGQIIATNTFDAFLQTNGNVMLGAMDPFNSIASPAADNFVIFDNVRVVDLSGVAAPETLTIVAADPTATEPSGDDGQLVITRTGSTASALTVPINVSSFTGTATRGTDFTIRTNGVITTANAVVIPAGSSSVTLDVVVINDTIGEAAEKAIVTLVGNPNFYDLGYSNYAVVDIADDNDLPTATVTTFRRAAYEGNTNSYGLFRIDFSSAYTLSDLTVNYTLAGTAASGTHYTTTNTTSVTMVSGTTNAFVAILAEQNADAVSNRTVVLTLASGVNYLVSTNGTTNGTVTIFNDDLPTPVATAFSDNFDVDSSAGWNVNFGTTPTRDRATFAYDYSADGIPSAPKSAGGSTIGLKLEANINTLGVGLFSGLSASPIGSSFTGDFRLRFDWWGNFPGTFPANGTGSTQLGTYGITRGGTFAQWPGSGSAAAKDSVYFAVTVDGGSGTDYRAYTNGGATLPTAVLAANAIDNLNAYYGVFGNLAAPPAQLLTPFGAAQTGRTALGAPGEVWHDVVITKLGSTLLWHMDGVLLATVNATKLGYNLSTNIFVGQSDINNGQATVPEMLFSLYDNLVVETLPAPPINITSITTPGTSRVLTFTGGASDIAAFYVLQQATDVTGPYTNNLTATITNNSPGVFTAVATNTAAAQFYRIRR